MPLQDINGGLYGELHECRPHSGDLQAWLSSEASHSSINRIPPAMASLQREDLGTAGRERFSVSYRPFGTSLPFLRTRGTPPLTQATQTSAHIQRASPKHPGTMASPDKIAEMQKIFQSSSQYTHLQVR